MLVQSKQFSAAKAVAEAGAQLENAFNGENHIKIHCMKTNSEGFSSLKSPKKFF